MDLILSLGALFFLGAFLTLKTRLHSGLAPLVSLSLVSVWFTLGGVWGVLRPAGWLFYGIAYGLGLWAVLSCKDKKQYKELFSPGAVVFWGLTLFFTVYFAVRQPMFSTFDEFSFWGTAAQMTHANNRLYPECPYGTPWLPTQNPGLIVLGYFVQFFGPFAHFKVYLAYDMLLFACVAALVGGLTHKEYRLAVPLAVIGGLTPWFLTTYQRMWDISKVYMSAYGDIPAGMLAGGAVALWFALRRTDGPRWAILPVLAFLANIKDNTFPLAMIIAGLIAADCFLFDWKESWRKGWGRRLGRSALLMVMPMTLYKVWGSYITKLVIQNGQAGGMGSTSEDPIRVAINGTRLLLGMPVPEFYQQHAQRFADSAAKMQAAFYETKLTAIGSGAVVTVLILGIFVAAILFAKDNQTRLWAFLWGLGSGAGYVAYTYVLTLCYGFIFKDFQAERLEDYNRYMYTYYLGWFLIAVAVLAWVAQTSRWRLTTHTGVLALSCGMLLLVYRLVPPDLGVLGFPDAVFADQQIRQSRAEAVQTAMGDDSRVFLVTQGDDGLEWFAYSCYLQPNVLDYSGWLNETDPLTGDSKWGGGGGTFGLPELQPSEDNPWAVYYHPYTQEEMKQLILESGCRYIFMDQLDDLFVESYGDLFADKLEAVLSGETLLYRVEADSFVPVSMEVPR